MSDVHQYKEELNKETKEINKRDLVKKTKLQRKSNEKNEKNMRGK